MYFDKNYLFFAQSVKNVLQFQLKNKKIHQFCHKNCIKMKKVLQIYILKYISKYIIIDFFLYIIIVGNQIFIDSIKMMFFCRYTGNIINNHNNYSKKLRQVTR
jgi:hypothetical protein